MAFRLVLITPPEAATPRELELATSLFKRGLCTLHLRKPSCDREQVAQYLAALPPDARRRTVLHQHHDLAKQSSIGGIHYREAERPPGVIKAPPGLSGGLGEEGQAGTSKIAAGMPSPCASATAAAVSTSFHTLPDLACAAARWTTASCPPSTHPSPSQAMGRRRSQTQASWQVAWRQPVPCAGARRGDTRQVWRAGGAGVCGGGAAGSGVGSGGPAGSLGGGGGRSRAAGMTKSLLA